tara:strand:+ start:395 stop:856 length:462 start_codon:yes stop_codon:yes gene_type:complete
MDNTIEKVYVKYKNNFCLFLPENIDEINNDSCEYIKGQVLHIEKGSYHPSEWYKNILIHKTNIFLEKDLDKTTYNESNESNNESDNESDNESNNESNNESDNESDNELVNLKMIHSLNYRDNYNNLIPILYMEIIAILFIFITLYNIDVNILF